VEPILGYHPSCSGLSGEGPIGRVTGDGLKVVSADGVNYDPFRNPCGIYAPDPDLEDAVTGQTASSAGERLVSDSPARPEQPRRVGMYRIERRTDSKRDGKLAAFAMDITISTRRSSRRKTWIESRSPAQRLANAASASCDSANEPGTF
jgi:hypothetical protein